MKNYLDQLNSDTIFYDSKYCAYRIMAVEISILLSVKRSGAQIENAEDVEIMGNNFSVLYN